MKDETNEERQDSELTALQVSIIYFVNITNQKKPTYNLCATANFAIRFFNHNISHRNKKCTVLFLLMLRREPY